MSFCFDLLIQNVLLVSELNCNVVLMISDAENDSGVDESTQRRDVSEL